jgi:hypothetical protein
MSPDTAEQAIADPASDLAVSAGSTMLGSRPELAGSDGYLGAVAAPPGLLVRVRADSQRMAALRDIWHALWVSRLLVWIAGAGAVVTFGFGPVRHAFDPPGITRGFGWLGDVLAAPAARWDAAWYLVIAHYGYRPELGTFTASRAAFFPLYPLGLSGLSQLGLQPVIAGVLLSVAAFAVALYCLHRLTTLELARLLGVRSGFPASIRAGVQVEDVARVTVMLTAFAPMAFYFSAVYSESLYMALSVGVFLCARRGRWALAAVLASLAGATRSTGVVLLAPVLLLYLYGPREDRTPDRAPRFRGKLDRLAPRRARVLAAGTLAGRFARTLVPRYRLRRDVLWLALIPVGLGLYMAHLALAGGDALTPFHAEGVWGRRFAGPYMGVWDGAKAAFEGLRQLLSLQRTHVYYPAAGGSPFIDAGHNLLLFVFLLATVPAAIGVLRLLPSAYGVYVLAALALPLSYPVAPQPLMSLPRFLLVLFPLNIWFAVRLASRPRAVRWVVLAASAAAMAFFVGEFATWHWVS